MIIRNMINVINMDNSQQIDLAAEYVKTLIAQDPGLQNKEVLYDKLSSITNELKSFDALMNGRLDFALIYKALSEKK